jgi:hypothetical protein
MVTPLRPGNPAIFALGWLLASAASMLPISVEGQVDVYRVSLTTTGGGPAITGFLYAVNDTAVSVLPATRLTRKGLQAVLEHPMPISIPTKLIKRVSISRVRTVVHEVTVGFLVSFGYAIAYLAVIPVNDPIDIIPYSAAVGALTLVTINLIYVRNFRPTKPGFTMLMQKYCLRKDDLAVDR